MFNDKTYIDKMYIDRYIYINGPAKPLPFGTRNLAGIFMGLKHD